MKKLLFITLIAMPLAYGLVWSEDPRLTEEQKEELRELNKRIAENMSNMRGAQQGNLTDSHDVIQEAQKSEAEDDDDNYD
jgi:hypothetical protein